MKMSFTLRRTITMAGVFAALILTPSFCQAHFQMIIPSRDIVETPVEKTLSLEILFTHPMEGGPVMEMGAPRQFGVLVNGVKSDLLQSLTAEQVDGKTAYRASYEVTGPGDYIFYLEPAPYWEPAEQKMIIHYTKVVVDAFGAGEGWDAMVGFPVEIEPLVRPYGLWTGNEFRGIVKKSGQPVPFAEIEVEYYNVDGKVTPPADPFINQVIKADAAGVFSYTMPRAGWWGFAALLDGDQQMKNPAGKLVAVELGGLFWIKCTDMK